jgi:cell division topological specificity factor
VLRLSSLLARIWGGQESSGDIARRRLQLVLVHDRTGLSHEAMESMKQNLLEVVSKYLVIDHNSVQIEVRRENESVMFVCNMLVNDVVRPEPVATSA